MRWTLVGIAVFATLAAFALGWVRAGETPPTVTSAGPNPSVSDGTDGASVSPSEDPMSWQGVDLAAVRAALPDNRYWEDGAPTDDPDLQASREKRAEERNLQYGRILSGTATEDEIDAYYDEREQISEDYVAFSRYVLTNYGSVLAERDTAMLELALSMNEQRLAQLPDERLRGHARKAEQDRVREDWDRARPDGNDQRPGG